MHGAPDAVVLVELRRGLASDADVARLLCGLLWQRHARVLEAFVRGRRADIADDAMSDLQLRFTRWCYGQSPLTAENLRALGYTMARAALKDALRRSPNWGSIDGIDAADAHDVVEQLFSDEAVAAILDGVAPRDRRILEAFLADVPDDELAAEVGIEPNALYVARHRALRRVRSQIEAAG